MADVLNEEDYKKILQNRFNNAEIKFLHAEVKPISENMEGFTGVHLQLIITYAENGVEKFETLFIKTKAKEALQAEFVNQINIYAREIFQYKVIHNEFRKYGYDVSFAPKSYYFIPDETIVMQNMTNSGYQLPERGEYYNVDQVQCLLKSLALYHGAGFAYELTKSKELDRHFSIEEEWPENFNEILFGESTGRLKEFWDGTLLSFHILFDLLPENEAYKKEFHQMLNEYDRGEIFSRKTKLPKTCGHGDLWSNNMFFKYENGIPVNCCLVDFQVSRYFYPGFDVLLAIYCNTSSEFRTKYLTKMYQYYYDTLLEIVHNYGYSLKEIMPFSDLYDSFKLVKVNVTMQTLMVVSSTYLTKEQLTESVKEANLTDGLFKNKDKMNDNAFKSNEKYRRAVSDALYDLREALIEYRKNYL